MRTLFCDMGAVCCIVFLLSDLLTVFEGKADCFVRMEYDSNGYFRRQLSVIAGDRSCSLQGRSYHLCDTLGGI